MTSPQHSEGAGDPIGNYSDEMGSGDEALWLGRFWVYTAMFVDFTGMAGIIGT